MKKNQSMIDNLRFNINSMGGSQFQPQVDEIVLTEQARIDRITKGIMDTAKKQTLNETNETKRNVNNIVDTMENEAQDKAKEIVDMTQKMIDDAVGDMVQQTKNIILKAKEKSAKKQAEEIGYTESTQFWIDQYIKKSQKKEKEKEF